MAKLKSSQNVSPIMKKKRCLIICWIEEPAEGRKKNTEWPAITIRKWCTSVQNEERERNKNGEENED